MLDLLEQVASKVEELYISRDPSQVNEDQRFLQEIQRSPQGYDVALYLLSRSSTTCQYFGALTLTVLLQQPDSSPSQCDQIVSDLLSYIKTFILDSSNPNRSLIVIRKLMSNISLAYLKNHEAFVNPILSFAQIYSSRLPPTLSTLDFSLLVGQLKPEQLEIMLIFLSILVEDISKSNDYRSSIHVAVRDHLYPLLIVVYEYLAYLMSQPHQELPLELSIQALITLQSWMSYIPNMNGDARYNNIDGVIAFLAMQFKDPIPELDPSQMDLIKHTFLIFNEVLEVNPNILSHDQKQWLYSTVLGSWGVKFMDAVIFGSERDGFHEEAMSYTELVLTILQLNSIRLSKSILDSNTQSILALAHSLTAIDGIPVAEELISERMLLFWEEFASVYQDSTDVFDTLFETQSDPQFQAAFEAEKCKIFDTIARAYWSKLHLPDTETYKQVRIEFNAYRSSVADFFLVAYALLKSKFYQLMCDSLIQASIDSSVSSESLLDVEATMYLLFKINDDTVYFESQANQLAPFMAKVFDSGFLSHFETRNADNLVQETVLATLIQFCLSNVFYFKTTYGSKHLADVFNIIFPLLLHSTNSTIALLASKTAMRICEECSEHLVSFLPDLETVVVGMLKNEGMDSLIRLRMFNAYSTIARRIKNEEEYCKVLYGMVSAIANAAGLVIRNSVESSKTILEAEEEYLSSLLSCLVNIAKGSSLSDDLMDEMLEGEQEAYRNFWQRDPYNIKQIVVSVVEEFSLKYSFLTQKTTFVEKCTLILKAGLGEKLGGAFSVGSETILQYVTSFMNFTNNPNSVPFIFGLAESLVSVEYLQMMPDRMDQLVRDIFTDKLAFLNSDPDMIKSAIDFFSKLLECKPSLIIYSDTFRTTIILFAVQGLSANELFVVRSISRFWTSFIIMRRGTNGDQAECQKLVDGLNLVQTVTSKLVASFVRTSRSNLDSYYTIFRSLIGKFPMQFKTCLSNIVMGDDVLVHKIGIKELELYIHKLMITRGRRTANEVLKLFWLAANGFVEYNTQKI